KPGERQKRKADRGEGTKRKKSPRSVSPRRSDATSQAIAFTYPAEDSREPKTVCRITPKRGSQLSRADDRRALRGRINNQAARNVISLCDMHRLPLPQIVRFLSTLDDLPEAIVFGWLALTTGMAPDRLLTIRLGDKGDPRLAPNTGIMEYTVKNRPNEDKHQIIQLQLNWLVSKSISSFSENLPQAEKNFEKAARKFSLHHPGLTPTLERISSSFFLHCSRMSELEAAYLSGDIPARLRAQAHYYPIGLSELNLKYQRHHQFLAKRILQMGICRGRFRTFLENLEPFPQHLPSGKLGSTHALPMESLQKLHHAICERATATLRQLKFTLCHERPHLLADFIQIQHLQLYLLEQLGLGMRKIGTKTSYALAPSLARCWGSEKASAAFSAERKTAPVIAALDAQMAACNKDWNTFAKELESFGLSIKGTFSHAAPLPRIVELDEKKKLVRTRRMNSSSFTRLLNEYQLNALPKQSTERVHPFKHFVAGELMG
ncbi:hypothetical protein D6779_02235, partial [Candidatus Parcubacteria bacterium]